MRSARLIAALLTVSLLGACVSEMSATPSATAPIPAAVMTDGSGQELNRLRIANGAGALQPHAGLMAAAQAYASELRADHTGAGGQSFTQRMRAAGCNGGGMAENIAWGQSSLQGALATWQASPPHRANMFNPSYRVYGLGQVGGSYVLMLADGC